MRLIYNRFLGCKNKFDILLHVARFTLTGLIMPQSDGIQEILWLMCIVLLLLWFTVKQSMKPTTFTTVAHSGLATSHHNVWSSLAQVIASRFFSVPNHNLSQWWLFINTAFGNTIWCNYHSFESMMFRTTEHLSLPRWENQYIFQLLLTRLRLGIPTMLVKCEIIK